MASLHLESFDLAKAERRLCEAALDRAGNIVDAAALLGITRHALKRRIIKYNIAWGRPSAAEVEELAPTGLVASALVPPTQLVNPAPMPPAETRASTEQRALSWLAVLAPLRLYNEEVGDALEVIAAMKKAGCPQYKIRLKVWSTVFWVFLNALRELLAGLTGRKSPHK